MSRSLHRSIATLLLLVLVVLQAGVVLAAHAYHADDAARVAAYGARNDGGDLNDVRLTMDSTQPASSVDALIAADCAEHCSGAAILMARPETPTLASRWQRIFPRAIRFAAVPPERLERPPKSTAAPV